jgi:hypothetical protein
MQKVSTLSCSGLSLRPVPEFPEIFNGQWAIDTPLGRNHYNAAIPLNSDLNSLVLPTSMPNFEIFPYYKSRLNRLPSNSCSLLSIPKNWFLYWYALSVGSMEYKGGNWHDQFADLETVV